MRLILLYVCLAALPASGQAQSVPPLSQPVIEVAAFRVAPVVRSAAGDPRTITGTQFPFPRSAEDIQSLPPAAAGERTLETRVQAAETWFDVVRRIAGNLGATPPGDSLSDQLRGLPPLLPGRYLRARLAAQAMEIDYVVKADESYSIQINGNALHVQPLAGDPRLIERMRADPAKASLFTAIDAVGLPESIALQLTEIFAGEIDFHRELHLGYRCAIVYEAHYREGFIERSGRILAVELEVGTRRFQAYHARDTQGRDAYFDASGKTTRRLFRRSPVEFSRVTSDFTLARFHPVLGVWRAHRGVDYAAPMGAKVMSVAEGVVDFVGTRGEYGNLVVLRHQDAFLTYYAHLSEFAPGLSPGSKVEQGQVVGLVGMTGLATGPHLHFEFHMKDASGAWLAVPAPDVIESTIAAAPGFNDVVRGYRTRLSVAETVRFVTLE